MTPANTSNSLGIQIAFEEAPVPPGAPPTDNANDNSIAAHFTQTTANGTATTVAETNQQWEFTAPGSDVNENHRYLETTTAFTVDSEGATLPIRLKTLPSGNVRFEFRIYKSTSVDNDFYRFSGSIGGGVSLNGRYTGDPLGYRELALLTYSSTDHQWLRFRVDKTNNKIHLETAPDNGSGSAGTWVSRYNETPGFSLADCKARFGFGNLGSLASSTVCVFDNFNLESSATTYLQSVSGVFGSSAGLSRRTSRSFAGISAHSGVARLRTSKFTEGTYNYSGVLGASKVSLRSLSGVLDTLSGVLGRRVGLRPGGVSSFSGVVVRNTRRSFSGVFAATGAVFRRLYRGVSGYFDSAGVFAKQIRRGLGGFVTAAGVLNLRSHLGLSGNLSFSSVLDAAKQAGSNVFSVAVSGVLEFTGLVFRVTSKSFGGFLGASGVIVRAVYVRVSGALEFSGGVVRRVSRALSGAIDFSGDFSRIPPSVNMYLSGVLGAFSGFVDTLKFSSESPLKRTSAASLALFNALVGRDPTPGD